MPFASLYVVFPLHGASPQVVDNLRGEKSSRHVPSPSRTTARSPPGCGISASSSPGSIATARRRAHLPNMDAMLACPGVSVAPVAFPAPATRPVRRAGREAEADRMQQRGWAWRCSPRRRSAPSALHSWPKLWSGSYARHLGLTAYTIIWSTTTTASSLPSSMPLLAASACACRRHL